MKLKFHFYSPAIVKNWNWNSIFTFPQLLCLEMKLKSYFHSPAALPANPEQHFCGEQQHNNFSRANRHFVEDYKVNNDNNNNNINNDNTTIFRGRWLITDIKRRTAATNERDNKRGNPQQKITTTGKWLSCKFSKESFLPAPYNTEMMNHVTYVHERLKSLASRGICMYIKSVWLSIMKISV